MEETDGREHPSERNGWRKLGAFWLAVLSILGVGAGVLQWLGPPGPAREASGKPPAVVHSQSAGDRGAVALAARPGPIVPVGAGRDTPGPVADPDPSLLEPAGQGSTENLPRIAADGRSAMNVYAAGFDHSSRRPRVALLLAGIGPNAAESDAAIRDLPGAVSLGVSPYAANLAKLMATARTAGHEYVIELPLEPTGFPLNDPGPYTLLTSGTAQANTEKLHWVLSRVDGYVGATGIIGTMRGERMAAMTDQMDAVLSELSGRGLLYVDLRQDRGPVSKAWGRHVDLIIDDPADRDVADRAMIDAKLAALEELAKDTGSALGLVMRPTPVAVARIAAWNNGLADRGLALAPVSALAIAPSDAPAKFTERGVE
jgi:polysaccharide deacetylase 2 family uncharacterized protein YibQ